MSEKLIRPGLTAAMTAGRALLAAGWRYDSTSPMANDTTIRTLLHPTGREIHARTVDGGEQTDLTMTGLSLEQVAGAVTGAGIAPAKPNGERDARRTAYEIATGGVAAGLPIPAAIEIPGHYDMFIVKLPNNDRAGVDAWARHLGLPEAQLGSPLKNLDEEVRDYKAETYRFPALPGWTVYVRCFVNAEDAS